MRSDPQLPPLLPRGRTRTALRPASDRCPMPTDSDRRLTFGSYARARRRSPSERARASLLTRGGNGKRHRSRLEGGMEQGGRGRQFLWLTQNGRLGSWGREMNRICVAIRARPRAKSARESPTRFSVQIGYGWISKTWGVWQLASESVHCDCANKIRSIKICNVPRFPCPPSCSLSKSALPRGQLDWFY